jgi:hypothetical protein
MTTVWILSEESPFDDPEASGGCVCGVFTSPAAALFALGAWDLGPEGMAAITWTCCGPTSYEGQGYGDAVYILRAYAVQDEATLRADYAAYQQKHHVAPDPFSLTSTADLLRLLPLDAGGV